MKTVFRTLIFACLLAGFTAVGQSPVDEFIVSRTIDENGKELVALAVPGNPPNGRSMPSVTNSDYCEPCAQLASTPGYDWSFGCSSTSAAMMAGYYDRQGYPNCYTGPVDGGIAPLNNSVWGSAVINGENRKLCPISATRQGLDGRTTYGHVDDYWYQNGSTVPDPYITGAWPQHPWSGCVSDFMMTNQSAWSNNDGFTTFYYYSNGSPYTGSGTNSDGTYGLASFFASVGYPPVNFYNQYIYGYNGNVQGFTYSQYMQQINAGQPVLLHLAGHTMLGVGYCESCNSVLVHDTWDYNLHEMTWGGTYAGYPHYGVSVVQLPPPTTPPIADFSFDPTSACAGSPVTFTDQSLHNPTSWQWDFTPSTVTYVGGTTSTSQNPVIQGDAGGTYSVTLTVANPYGTSTKIIPGGLVVNPRPVASITGPSPVCEDTEGHVYSTESGMTNYFWTVSAGGAITGGQGSSSITVDWNDPGGQTVMVMYQDANGCEPVSPGEKDVTVHPTPVPTIAGPDTTCANDITATYTTESGMTDYDWNISGGGGSITAGSGTNSITVTWSIPGTYIVSVSYVDANGCPSTVTEYTVEVLSLPVASIVGDNDLCVNTTGVVYTTQGGQYNYTWNISAGGTITANNGYFIVVTWHTAGDQWVSVAYIDEFGCLSAPVTYPVTVRPLPVPTITGPTPLCAGAAGNTYTTEAGMSNYVWTVSAGGTITGGAGTNAITVTWNTAGAQTVTVNYTNGYGCTAATPASFPVTVNPLPAPTIAGPTPVCVSTGGHTYTTEAGMANYIWTVSAGGTITGGAGTNAITVTWTTAGAQTVTVNYTNANGCTAALSTSFGVMVNPLPVPTITGPVSICEGATGNTYTTEAGMTNYTWTVSAGGTITGGAGTNAITVTWTTAGAQTVSVNYTNAAGCTAQTPGSLAVTVSPVPSPSITGPVSVCMGTGSCTYSTEAGMSNYAWTVSTGGVINSGQGTATVSVSWNTAGSHLVTVNYMNAGGCQSSIPGSLDVTVTALPDPAGVVTGTAMVCAGTPGVVYTTTPIGNTTFYVWTVPPGATIASGSGTTSITVDFSPTSQSGDITVCGNNICGNGTASSPFPVTVSELPGACGPITGLGDVCEGDLSIAYSVDPIPNATSYTWSVPAGAVIVSGAGTNAILVDFGAGAASGEVAVCGTNSCGDGQAAQPLAVEVHPVPAVPVVELIDDTLYSTAPEGNQWLLNNQPVPGATQSWLVPGETGWYGSIVTLANCSSDTSNLVYAVVTAIASPAWLQGKVYPNPTNGTFTIRLAFPNDGTVAITLFNHIGNPVFDKEVTLTSGTACLNVELPYLPEGVYTLIVKGNNQLFREKILLFH